MLPLPHVQPGNLVTSELLNAIIDQLNGLKGRPGDLPLILGPLAEQTRTLVALGTGFEAGGGIWLDGEPLLAGAPGRGISLVILEPNLRVKFRGTYDTFGDNSSSARLVQDIQSSTQPYDVVVGVTHDAFARLLQSNAKAALASVGAAALALAGVDTRSAAAFIGVVPPNKGAAQFNYIVSVLPPDAPGTGASPRLAAQPFAWGVYSVPMQRFVLGGASGQLPGSQILPTSPTFPTSPTATLPTTFPTLITTLTATLPTDFTVGTGPITLTFPTDFTVGTFPTDFTIQTIPTGPIFTGPILTLTLSTANIATNLLPGFGLVQPEDEVTVLPGMGITEKEKLSGAGIVSVRGLVDTPVDMVASTLNISSEAAAGLIGTARRSLGG
jgi:hypothetical protein